MERRFTLQEAEKLLPEVEKEIRQAVSIKSEFSKAESELEGIAQRVAVLGGSVVNRQQLVRLRSRRDALASRLKEIIEEIHGYGCLVKDLDIGLIDFPTLFRGEEVYLCWKLGESGIRFWHGVDEGYRGRKPIDEDFLENHRGDPPN